MWFTDILEYNILGLHTPILEQSLENIEGISFLYGYQFLKSVRETQNKRAIYFYRDSVTIESSDESHTMKSSVWNVRVTQGIEIPLLMFIQYTLNSTPLIYKRVSVWRTIHDFHVLRFIFFLNFTRRHQTSISLRTRVCCMLKVALH